MDSKRYVFLVTVLLCAAPLRADLVLEFFQGTSVNDTVINLPAPLTAVNIPAVGSSIFVQVVLRQTAPTALLDATDGLAAYLAQGDYDNAMGVFQVPGTTATSTAPLVNVANSAIYSLVRAFRPPGANQSTATGFRFGGLSLEPPPSPSVDANGRIFLGTFRIDALGIGAGSIIFLDPNPAPSTTDNISDQGDNLDAVLYNGMTHTLPIIVGECPTIDEQPTNQTRCVGDEAAFTVTASGPAPLTFQWRRGTTNLVDGGSISGATTPTLMIDPVSLTDAANDYNCVVTHFPCSVTSQSATLSVMTCLCQEWRAGPLDDPGEGVINVEALTTFGTRIIAGGDFIHSTDAGPSANNIIGYDGLTLSALGSGMNDRVSALKAFIPASGNRQLVAGGFFTTAGGVSANRIARWIENENGSPPPAWAPMGSGFNAQVLALERVNGSYVAGGAFNMSGSTLVNRVALWNESTATWSSMSGGMNGPVRALEYYTQQDPPPFPVLRAFLVAGGVFTTAGAVAANNIAICEGSLFVGGGFSAWEPMGSGFNGNVLAVVRHGGSTFAAGTFTASGATPLGRIARWNGSAWVQVGNGSGFNFLVRALASSGSDLYAAGDFSSVDGIPALRVARWNGTAWQAVSPVAPNTSVYSLNPFNGELHAGGPFDILTGQVASPGWARFHETGVPWIVNQPVAQGVDCGDAGDFSVDAAEGFDPLSYQWRKDTVPLGAGPTGTGSTIVINQNLLSIQNTGPADEGLYDCVISNDCGSVTSSSATLVIDDCPPAGDLNCDGAINSGDIAPMALALTDSAAYQQQFPNCNALNGDMNQDGSLDGRDIGLFVNCLINGGCP